MRVHLLRSPKGGGRSSRDATGKLLNDLRADGHELIDLTGASSAESANSIARAIADGQVERVLLCGGDGLVHLAIQALAETPIPVTIAPTGTGNDFAAALGISTATSTSIHNEAAAVDLLRIELAGGVVRWAASIAIAGFPAAINARANGMQLPLGSQIYTVAAALELPRFRRVSLSLRVDGEDVETDSAMLAIGNTALFGGGMLACPDAHPSDGHLHLTSIEGVGRFGILRHLAGRAGGTADRPEVQRRAATRIDVMTPDVEFWADGEPVGPSPLTITVAPRALVVTGADET